MEHGLQSVGEVESVLGRERLGGRLVDGGGEAEEEEGLEPRHRPLRHPGARRDEDDREQRHRDDARHRERPVAALKLEGAGLEEGPRDAEADEQHAERADHGEAERREQREDEQPVARGERLERLPPLRRHELGGRRGEAARASHLRVLAEEHASTRPTHAGRLHPRHDLHHRLVDVRLRRRLPRRLQVAERRTDRRGAPRLGHHVEPRKARAASATRACRTSASTVRDGEPTRPAPPSGGSEATTCGAPDRDRCRDRRRAQRTAARLGCHHATKGHLAVACAPRARRS